MHYCCECEESLYPDPCVVCLGRGRISDRVTVAQAMADAETLYPFLPPGSLIVAEPSTLKWWLRSLPSAVSWGQNSARAAFCAVPALKGEA